MLPNGKVTDRHRDLHSHPISVSIMDSGGVRVRSA